MSLGVKIGFIIILLHLIVGFGFMIYKLAPRKGDKQYEESTEEEHE